MIPNQRIQYLKSLYISNKTISLAEVLALADQESGGYEYFTENDHLFIDNLNAAHAITGLSIDQLKAAVLITPAKYNQFFLKYCFGLKIGDPARYIKFRCEPSIFNIVKNRTDFTMVEKFLLSCSMGIGQRLVYYWISNSRIPASAWIKNIKSFSIDVSAQIKELVNNMSWWLLRADGNRILSYSMYNAGSVKQPTAYGYAIANKVKLYANY